MPSSTPARKKPSALATLILLGVILGFLGVVAGGGYWAYRTFIAKSREKVAEIASNVLKTPLPPLIAPEMQPPTAPPVPPRTPPKPSVIERLGQPSAEPSPGADPVVAAIPTPTVPTPAEPSTPPPTPPGTTPAEVAATDPLPDPDVPPAPAEPSPVIAAEPDPVVPAEPIQTFDEADPQVAALKADADRRIDEAPPELYSDADKQRVRDAIRQSKRLTKVATLQFGAGAATLGANEKNRLKKALLSPEAEALLSDPQAVFFLLGFADATGASDVNRRISQKRAAAVADVLKNFKVPNSSYAVGIGATTLLSTEKQSRNRATEVWVVLP